MKWRYIFLVAGTYGLLLSVSFFAIRKIKSSTLPFIATQNIFERRPRVQVDIKIPAEPQKPADKNALRKVAPMPLLPDVKAAYTRVPACNPQPQQPSSDRLIGKLIEYRSLCLDVKRHMVFVSMPINESTAKEYADDMAGILKSFADHAIDPLVILEPSSSGTNFDTYAKGGYDAALRSYFSRLKTSGISDTQMGMWVHMPEANTPAWGKYLQPEIVAQCVNRSAGVQKIVFPSSQATIMLNSTTFGPATDWSDGKSISFAPYIRPIKQGLLDSFGIQGFPWQSARNQENVALHDASGFLNAALAIEAARILNIQSVWFNTGTYRTKYASEPESKVTVNPETRLAILQSVIRQADKVQAAGMELAINIFSEDKSAVSEATDWSYWHNGAAGSEDSLVLQSFATVLAAKRIELWLYDSL